MGVNILRGRWKHHFVVGVKIRTWYGARLDFAGGSPDLPWLRHGCLRSPESTVQWAFI
jgi:hypothetical protein